MNSKLPSKKASVAKTLMDIPAAYDIAAVLLDCRKKGLKARPAIAWMEGGRVQVTFDEESINKRVVRNMRDEIYQRWCAELGLTFTAPNQPQPSEVTVPETRLARCVAFSNGADWSASKPMDVCHFLLNPLGTPPDRGFSIIPLDYTIFSPDMSAAVWLVKYEARSLHRCMEFGWILLSDIARVYCLAVEFIDGFEIEFNSTDESSPWTAATLPAALLHDCKKATLKLISSVAQIEYRPKIEPDAGVALRQGFLIGKKLAQAEGMISNVRETAWLSTIGKGRSTSKFWKWVNSDPIFKGKSASETLVILNGKRDPDFPGKTLILTDEGLIRGNEKVLRTTSFTAKYKSR